MSRSISIKVKNNILNRQNYKCATIKNYNCLLWQFKDGEFDEAGYEIDHIDEYSITHDNNIDNLQALCPNCHAVKTKRFMTNKKFFTSTEIDGGAGLMDVEIQVHKKQKKTK